MGSLGKRVDRRTDGRPFGQTRGQMFNNMDNSVGISCEVHLGHVMSGAFWELFCHNIGLFFSVFRGMAKSRKIARRVGESTRIEGWGVRNRPKINEKSHQKRDANMKRKIIPK